jgi:hypothetical protein
MTTSQPRPGTPEFYQAHLDSMSTPDLVEELAKTAHSAAVTPLGNENWDTARQMLAMVKATLLSRVS